MSPSEVYKPPAPSEPSPSPVPIPPAPAAPVPPASTSPIPTPAASTPPQNPTPRPASPAPGHPGRKRIILWITGLLLACCVVTVGSALGYGLISSGIISFGGETSNTSEDANNTAAGSFSQVQTKLVSVDGSLQKDGKGVSVKVLPVEGRSNQPVNLVSNKPGKDFTDGFKGLYSVESLAYSLSADGTADTARRGEIVFPAKSPNDRLAVIIDQKYMGILAILPENGQFKYNPRVDLADPDPSHSPVGVEQQFTQYMVVHPQKSSQSPRIAQSAGGLQSVTGEEELASCGTWYHNYCWSDKDATVFIFFDKETNLSYPFLDLIAASKKALSTYKGMGFTGADLSKSNPLYIVVGGDQAPYYSSKTGNLYVPLDILARSNDPAIKYTIAHELFHWTEDEAYPMTANALSGPESWWLEMAAENGAYMVNRESAGNNLKEYGRASGGSTLSFLLTPFEWSRGEEARYIHAQNFLVSLCEGGAGCAISEKDMIAAVNAGTYPYSSADVQQRYKLNSIDTARYLIGLPPVQSNTGVYLPPEIKTGRLYGDFIHGKKKGTKTEFVTSNTSPTFVKGASDVVVTAAIPAGGVYPLRISNGSNGPDEEITNLAGAPLYLLVEPGQNFFLKVGNDAPADGTGKGKLMIGPIHDKLGYDAVRVNAYAQENPGEFKASVGIINLSGDWVGKPGKLISSSTTCPSEDGEDETATIGTSDMILNLLSAYGVFNRDPSDPSGATLVWEQTVSIEEAENVTIEAKAIVGSEDIRLTWLINIPKSTSGLFERRFAYFPVEKAPAKSSLPWALASFPAAGLLFCLSIRPRRKIYLTVMAISALSLVLLSSGCGLKNIYGSLSGDYVFTKIVYPEKDFSYPAEGDIYWNLSGGKHAVTYDIFTEAWVDLFDESKGFEEKECVVKINYTLDGTVQKDGLVGPDSLNSSSSE